MEKHDSSNSNHGINIIEYVKKIGIKCTPEEITLLEEYDKNACRGSIKSHKKILNIIKGYNSYLLGRSDFARDIQNWVIENKTKYISISEYTDKLITKILIDL